MDCNDPQSTGILKWVVVEISTLRSRVETKPGEKVFDVSNFSQAW